MPLGIVPLHLPHPELLLLPGLVPLLLGVPPEQHLLVVLEIMRLVTCRNQSVMHFGLELGISGVDRWLELLIVAAAVETVVRREDGTSH